MAPFTFVANHDAMIDHSILEGLGCLFLVCAAFGLIFGFATFCEFAFVRNHKAQEKITKLEANDLRNKSTINELKKQVCLLQAKLEGSPYR